MPQKNNLIYGICSMNKAILYLLSIVTLLIITSCGEDRSGEYYALVEENKWIEQQMRAKYLWNKDIPSESELKFFETEEKFFASLLSKTGHNGKKDNFSYIQIEEIATKSETTGQASYGFHYALVNSNENANHRYARVLYILPNSPAAETGLKRGDWIAKIDGEPITASTSSNLLTGTAVDFTLALPVFQNERWEWVDKETIHIGAARYVEESPVFMSRILNVEAENGERKKIGYLVYNSFTSGLENNPSDDTYIKELIAVFRSFQQENLDEFILDLRYNQGGLVRCAEVLGSLLVPTEDYGLPFFSLTYNSDRESENHVSLFDAQVAEGVNLGFAKDQKVYVITGKNTASASEIIIACLKKQINIVQIGTTTVGKDLASESITSEKYSYINMYPIVAQVADADGNGYPSGLKPDFNLDESVIISDLQPLGDPTEYLLANTLSVIFTGDIIKEEEEKEEEEEEETPQNSRKLCRSILFSGMNTEYYSIEDRPIKGIILP